MHLVKILNTFLFFYSFFFHFFIFIYFLCLFIIIFLVIYFNTYLVLHCLATGMQNGEEASSDIILAD